METYLQLEGLTKSVGDRMLFADITFGINEGDKIGIIAKNGTGKSTLLDVIAGHTDADSGSIVWRGGLNVAYLEQDPKFPEGASTIEGALDSDSPEACAVKAYEQALATGDNEALSEASHCLDSLGAWDYEDRLRQLLTRLHLTEFDKPVNQLSGGQRKRLALAREIMREPDLIMLDEPTNHLDIEIIEWLENYLRRSRMAILMVTHDRYFLDRVCNRINRPGFGIHLRRQLRLLPATPGRAHRSHGCRADKGKEHSAQRAGLDEPTAAGQGRKSKIPHRRLL